MTEPEIGESPVRGAREITRGAATVVTAQGEATHMSPAPLSGLSSGSVFYVAKYDTVRGGYPVVRRYGGRGPEHPIAFFIYEVEAAAYARWRNELDPDPAEWVKQFNEDLTRAR